MRNEKEYFYQYNEVEHNLDFEIVFKKTVYALLVFVF